MDRFRFRSGSITVFMSLMLFVVSSLFFAILEVSRYEALGMEAKLTSQSVTESMFAEYGIPAYRDYHLLFLDSGYGTGELRLSEINNRMQKLAQENLNPEAFTLGSSYNLLRMNATDSSVLRYELATDSDVAPLLQELTEVAKNELASDILEAVTGNGAAAQDSLNQGKAADGYLEDAMDTLQQAQQDALQADGTSVQTGGISVKEITVQSSQLPDFMQRTGILNVSGVVHTDSGGKSAVDNVDNVETYVDNPMEDVQSAKKSPVLAQIFGEGMPVSGKKLPDTDSLVSRRTLNTGNYGQNRGINAVDKMLVIQYLKNYTTNYIQKLPDMPHALSYEQEYLLFGKGSDRDNLKKMVERLLLVREGVNFIYLQTDAAKQEEALAMATSIAVSMGVPAAAPAIQQGILASWAYAESVLEVRTLYAGGSIAAVKTAENWTLELFQVAAALFDTSLRAKSVSGGQDYEDFIQAFLFLESTKKLGKRFADILEQNLRLNAGYEQCKLDCMITTMETVNTYEANQKFLSFVLITKPDVGAYSFQENDIFSYLRDTE